MTLTLLVASLAAGAFATPRVLDLSEPGPGARHRGRWGVFNVLTRTPALEAFLSRPKLQPDWYAARADKLVVALAGTVELKGTAGPLGRGELWLTPRGALQSPVMALAGPQPRLVKVHAPRQDAAPVLAAPPSGGPRRLSWRPAAVECASDPAPLCRRPLAAGDTLTAALLRVRGDVELASEPGRERVLVLMEGAVAAGPDATPAKSDAVLLLPAGETLRLGAAQSAVLIEASALAP